MDQTISSAEMQHEDDEDSSRPSELGKAAADPSDASAAHTNAANSAGNQPAPIDPSSARVKTSRANQRSSDAGPPPIAAAPVENPLVEMQEKQDAEFIQCETEYLETLASLPSDDNSTLARFKEEYERMHKAVLRSRHHAAVLFHQNQEIHSEHTVNQSIMAEGARTSQQDKTIIDNLTEQIRRNEEILEASAKREETSKEELKGLKAEIQSLSNTLKQGVGLSAAQERTLNELTANRESAAKELDTILERIVHLRNDMSSISEKIRNTEQLKRDRERDIYDLKERNASKKADIDAEIRNKERLERDLRELRVVVAVKSQEVRGKQDAVNRATDEIHVLESQIKAQKQMLEKLYKDREALQARKTKFEQDCNEQITMTSQLMEDNAQLSHDITVKEAELSKNRIEVKRVNKVRDALVKKNKALEEQRLEAEQERRALKSSHELNMAEIERVNRSIDLTRKTIDDLTRERDILQMNSLKTTNETAKHVQASILCRQTRHNLELELARENKDVAEQLDTIRQLETERNMYVDEAVKLQTLCVQGLQDIKEKELEIFEFKKKMIKADTKLKHQQNLYEAVQSDRNLHAKHLIEAQSAIQEMKRKLKIMNFQINGYKEEINAKNEALEAEVADNAKLEKDIEIITDEVKTLKHQNELAQAYIRSQLAEEMKLNMFVKEAELERLRQENALQVLISERDNLSAQLIRQNEELARAYNKIKTQQSSLIISERHYRERLAAIRSEIEKISALKSTHRTLLHELAELEPAKRHMHRLRSDIVREKARIKALEDELQNPVNIHRWRKLEGSNPKAFEMIQMLHALQRNLIARTAEEREKERLIEIQERLYLHLNGILAKQVGPEALEQVEEFEKAQAQVKEHQHAIESLNAALSAVKESYLERRRKKGSHYEPNNFDMELSERLPKLAESKDGLSTLPPLPKRSSIVAIDDNNNGEVAEDGSGAEVEAVVVL